MDSQVMFLDCPAYTGDGRSARCGLPAEVESRYTISSSDGPLESAKIRCPRGHWFNGPIESLTVPGEPTVVTGISGPAAVCERMRSHRLFARPTPGEGRDRRAPQR